MASQTVCTLELVMASQPVSTQDFITTQLWIVATDRLQFDTRRLGGMKTHMVAL